MIVSALTASQSLAQPTYEPYTFSTPGNAVYVADSNDSTIRKVMPTGVVTTLAGRAGSPGSADGVGSTARFNRPSGVAVESAGNLYVVDLGNHTIRKGYAAFMILSSGPGFGFKGGQFDFNLAGAGGKVGDR